MADLDKFRSLRAARFRYCGMGGEKYVFNIIKPIGRVTTRALVFLRMSLRKDTTA